MPPLRQINFLKMNSPIYSIITICLNDMNGLIRTRESVRKQTNSDFEWIVIDGASRDGTKEFLEKLSTAECQWISESDKGLYDAMNKGIERATGEYLIFLNSGDEFASPDVLQEVSKSLLQTNMPSLIYGDSLERNLDASLVYKPARNHAYLWYGMFTHHQAMFYKRTAVGSLRYSLLYPIGADYGFTAELIKRNSAAEYLSMAICTFERGGLSEKNIYQGESDQYLIRREIMNYPVFICMAIKAAHELVRMGKKFAPSLHSFLRYSNN